MGAIPSSTSSQKNRSVGEVGKGTEVPSSGNGSQVEEVTPRLFAKQFRISHGGQHLAKNGRKSVPKVDGDVFVPGVGGGWERGGGAGDGSIQPITAVLPVDELYHRR